MNPDLIKKIGEAVAKELLSTGIPWTFAPTIAVPQNDLWEEHMRVILRIQN